MQQEAEIQALQASDAVRAVSRAIAVSDYLAAYSVADSAISQGHAHPALFNARALWLERQQRDEEALFDFQRAASMAPHNTPILNAIGLCLTRLYRLDEAIAAFDEAIRQTPNYAPSHCRKGVALGLCGRFVEAQRAHEQAIKLDPSNAEALANLASLAARIGDAKKTEEYAKRALRVDPRQATAIAAKAFLANAQGRFAEAEQQIRPLLGRPDFTRQARATALGQLADSLDGQNRVEEAFETYRAENEELLRLHTSRYGSKRSVTQSTADLDEFVRSVPPDALLSCDGYGTTSPPHVFVMGFFRSGTTLLGQVLASHSEIETIEEHDFLAKAASTYLSSVSGQARLMSISGDELEQQRQSYWQNVKAAGFGSKGKILVDKLPLNTIKLPLIAKLFPHAKIVLAVRDPRDVVLSCFRRHFEINAAMFDLLTLEGAAALYGNVMQFAQLMESSLREPLFVNRYEDLIADFDGRAKALCEYIGVAFDPAMREFHANTRIEEIRSPSALQVTRKLYSEGAGQWRRYREHLAPVIPILTPWIVKYGYSEE